MRDCSPSKTTQAYQHQSQCDGIAQLLYGYQLLETGFDLVLDSQNKTHTDKGPADLSLAETLQDFELKSANKNKR